MPTPDISGAIAAIQQRLSDNWSTTPIRTPNDGSGTSGPADGSPFVYSEVSVTRSAIRAAGKPGSQTWIYVGLVEVSVFVKAGDGTTDAFSYASQIGEIFRNETFYNDTPGYEVRTLSPWVSGGDSGSDDGAWFRVTATVQFEYYHQG